MPGFMSAMGGMTPAIQEALQRRQAGGGPSPMDQVGQGAPTFDPTQQPGQVGGQVPGVPPVASLPSQPPGGIPPMGLSQGMAPNPNDTLIIKALATKLNQKSGF